MPDQPPVVGPNGAIRSVVATVLGLLAVGWLAMVGCAARPASFLNENDRLRQENLALGQVVEKLKKDLRLRSAQIEGLEQRLGNAVSLAGVKPGDLPRVVSLVFGRYSGLIDTDDDALVDTVRVYARTLDQHGRFFPAVGAVRVQAVAVRPGHEPVVLANAAFDPPRFTAAYRSGLTGTHFTLKTALTEALPEGVERVTVKVVFTDAATGVSMSCEQPFPVGPGAAVGP